MLVWLSVLLFLAPPQTDPPKPATVEGRVLDARSGEPIRKALVILRRAGDRGLGAYTDAAGKFAFTAVEPDSYALSAERDGYVADPQAKPIVLVVKPAAAESGLSLKLLPTGAVSGRVLDADGDPVIGVSVQIQSVVAKKNQPGPSFGATTNDRGEYRAFNVAPGKYHIVASYSPALRHPNVNLQRPADLSGPAVEQAYALTYFPSSLNARDAATVQVDAGADLAGFDLQLRRSRAVHVRGTLTVPAGATLGLVTVSLLPAGREGLSSDELSLATDGHFDLSGVVPGKYVLAAEAPLTNNHLTARLLVDVGDRGLDGVQLALLEPQPVSGRILVPQGRQLSAVFVTLASRDHHDQQSGGMAQPAADGTFTVTPLAPGDYDVALASTGPGDDLYVAAIRLGQTDALADGVHIAGLPLPKLEITLKANGGALESFVSNADHEAVADAQVILLPDAPHQSQMALFGECRTNPGGSCSITGITPGDYHLFAFATALERDFRDPDTVKDFQKLAKPVKIAAGDRLNIALQAIPEPN